MNFYILLFSVVIILCVICNRISNKLGVPVLLIFIALGMFFGSDGVIKIPFDNFVLAENVCTAALIFIMFYGGFGTKWKAAKPVAAKAVLMSTAGVVMTAFLVGLFCHFVIGINFQESLLLGALVGSTDAASVFSILRSKRLNLKYHTASLLEVESGSNDPCAYMLTMIMLSIIGGDSMTVPHLIYLVFAQIVYGAATGVIAAVVTGFIMKKVSFATQGFDTIFVFAMVLLAYAVPSEIGGNGYLSVYIFGIILGNMELNHKKPMVNFFDGLTGLMQMLLFFLLGLLSFPSVLPQVLLPAVAIALFLTLVARPLTVFALLSPFGCPLKQQLLVALAGLRGAASVVFAIMTVTHPANIENDLFHIVFCIVLFSILIQGMFLPVMAKKLDMIDEKEDVLKTFTDYTEEVPVQFIQFTVTPDHSWNGKQVKDIILPPETLLVQMRQEEETITPDGNTMLQAGNVLILSAKAMQDVEEVHLTELTLDRGNKWIGKMVSEICPRPGKLVIMIQRAEDIIIPNGKTILEESDVLVMKET